MPMHILQLGPYPPPEGGITRNMLAIRERLVARGDRCSIIVTSRSTHIREEADVYHTRSAIELITLLRKIDHDILHLHVGGDVTRRVLSLMIAAATFGKRPVLSFHSGGYPKTAEAQKARPTSARGKIFRRFDRIVAVNGELADVFRRYGVESDKLAIIAPFALAPPSQQSKLRENIAAFADAHVPLLVSVGGLEPDYEPLFLINAMNGVLRRHPDAGLVIVGGGSMKNRVEAAVAHPGHAGSVLLAGDLPHDETLKLIARADAMLRITLFDGDAISVREALFLGTPVIATDNGMRPDGVISIRRGDAEQLLENIDAVLAGSMLRPQSVTPDFSNVDKVLTLYDELLQDV
jgi:glycogen(starch) synthase